MKKRVIDLLSKDNYAALSGVELVDVGEGTATAKMIVSEKQTNGLGTVQGGALFTLADLACAAAANSRDKIAVSLGASINFVKAVSSGVLTATAKEVYVRRTISAYSVEIHDEKGDLVATFQSTFYRKDPH